MNFLPLWALKAALALCVPLQMSVLLTISPFWPPCIETITLEIGASGRPEKETLSPPLFKSIHATASMSAMP